MISQPQAAGVVWSPPWCGRKERAPLGRLGHLELDHAVGQQRRTIGVFPQHSCPK